MKQMVLPVVVLLVGASFADEPIVVGTGETLVTNIAADVVNAAQIRLSDRATIVKEGAGTWSLKSGDFTRNQPVTVQVREGGVAYAASEPLAAYPEPTDVLAKALLHLDAAATASLKLKDGSDTDVDVWLDVRETGDGSAGNPYQYIRAITNFQCSTTSPQLTTYLSKAAIDCKGIGSGVWMNWVKPDGSQATCGKLRNVFVVHGDATASWGNVLGQRVGSNPFFQTGASALWMGHNGENRPMHASRTYLNGLEIDPFRTPYPSGSRIVVEVECLGDDQSAQCFYNDRDMQTTWPDGTEHLDGQGKKLNPFFNAVKQVGGGNRVGGGYICEVILFTNQLTSVERLAVSDWLNQKWQGTLPPSQPDVSVQLGTNTAFALNDNLSCHVSGDGELVKTGDSTVRFRAPLAPRQDGPLALRVEQGKVDLGYALPIAFSAGDTLKSDNTYLGPQVSAPTAGADPTVLTKTGDGPLTLAAVPPETRRLSVESGVLTLSDPERSLFDVVKPLPPVGATGGSFGFEEFHTEYSSSSTVSVDLYDGQSKYGWHAVVPATTSGKPESKVFFFDASYGKDKGSSWSVTIGAQDGYCSLGVKNNASAWTEVDFPEAGVYTFTVWVAGRSGQTGLPVRLLLGKTAESLTEFGTLIRTDGAMAFRRFTFLTPPVEAGRYQFWFKAPDSDSSYYDTDKCYQYDAISFEKSAVTPGVFPIPNGDFETYQNGRTISTFTLDSTNAVAGFIVKQADNVGSSTASNEALGHQNAYTTFNVANTSDAYAHFNLPWNRPGSKTQLYMSGNGSSLTTTFCPPAGTWRLRADAGVWQVSTGKCDYYDLNASLTIGEAAPIDLGRVELYSHKMAAQTWPTAFTSDGETPVTLVVSGSVHADRTCGHALLDNLELVPTRLESTNLISDSGFEKGGWSLAQNPRPSGVTGSGVMTYGSQDPSSPSYFCANHFTRDFLEGSYCFKIVNDERIFCDATLATPGIYRLTANMTSRCNPGGVVGFGNGANPVAAYIARNGVTNWLGCTEAIQTTNYCEYAFTFRIPEGQTGVYSVGFKGQSVWGGEGTPSVDRTTLVDVVCLYPIETEGSVTLPEETVVNVKSGARLVLDFDGTNRINRLRVNGRGYSGTVSSETHPELFGETGPLSGRGAFEVAEHGLRIIVR